MEKTKRYKIVVIAGTVLVSLLALLTSYLIAFVSNNLDLGVEWNMFKSILIYPLYIVGLVGSFMTKIRGVDTIIKTTYSDGRAPKYEKDNDIISWMFGHIVLPGLMRFFLVPCAIAALIYYPLMLLWSLAGIVLPYILAIAILVVPFFYNQIANNQILVTNRHIRVPLLTSGFIFALFIFYTIWAAFGGIGYLGGYSSESVHGIASLGILALFLIVFLSLILTAEEDTEVDLIVPEPMSKRAQIGLGIGAVFSITVLVLGAIFYSSSSDNGENYSCIDDDYSSIADQLTYTHTINASSLNVRMSPSSTGTIVGKLDRGEKVNVQNIVDGWATITYDGSTAYISSEYIIKLGESSKGVVIPKTTGRMSTLAMGWEDYLKEPSLSQSEIERLRLPTPYSDQFYVKGKEIYRCDKGWLETYLSIKDSDTEEYLVSYDNNGNEIDKLLIGNIRAYAGDRMYGELEGKQIILHSDYPGEGDEETYATQRYKISDELRFIKQ